MAGARARTRWSTSLASPLRFGRLTLDDVGGDGGSGGGGGARGRLVERGQGVGGKVEVGGLHWSMGVREIGRVRERACPLAVGVGARAGAVVATDECGSGVIGGGGGRDNGLATAAARRQRLSMYTPGPTRCRGHHTVADARHCSPAERRRASQTREASRQHRAMRNHATKTTF